MVSFNKRSSRLELMDAQNISKELIHKNLGELDTLNRYFGGHNLSIKGIKRLITNPEKVYHIADIGCGGGDTLKYIARWARSHSIKFKLTGVDRNPDAIGYLLINCAGYPEIEGVVGDYRDYLALGQKIDIVHCSLFCHHLNDLELLELLGHLKVYAGGFVINDLQRNPLAYVSAWLMTRLLNGTSLSKHDGPVSVLRAFKKNELLKLMTEAGIKDFSIRWHWAFRFLVVAKTDEYGSG